MDISIPKDRPLNEEERKRFIETAVSTSIAMEMVSRYIRETEVIVITPDDLAVTLRSLGIMIGVLLQVLPKDLIEEAERQYATPDGKVALGTLHCVQKALGPQSAVGVKEEEEEVRKASTDAFFVQGSGQA